MAAGALFVGSWPCVPEIEALLRSPCAMIPAGTDPHETLDLLRHLRADPATPSVRRRNSRQALLGHDWSHRWQKILDAIGCDPLPALAEHQNALSNRAIELA